MGKKSIKRISLVCTFHVDLWEKLVLMQSNQMLGVHGILFKGKRHLSLDISPAFDMITVLNSLSDFLIMLACKHQHACRTTERTL